MKNTSFTIAFFILIIGWALSQISANAREKRKEHRDILDNLSKDCDSLRVAARKFLTNRKRNEELRLQVHQLVNKLGLGAARVAKISPSNAWWDELIELRQALDIIDTIEDSEIKIIKHGSPYILEITARTEDLYRAMEKSFDEIYYNDSAIWWHGVFSYFSLFIAERSRKLAILFTDQLRNFKERI